MDEPPPVVIRYIDACNARDVDAMLACLDQDRLDRGRQLSGRGPHRNAPPSHPF